jgi:hypothetical protein
MGQQYGAAQPIVDAFSKIGIGKKEEKKPPPQKADTSWHDAEVRKANESFRKAPEEGQKVGKKVVQKPVKKPTLANKRTARKKD